jgi:hypothetical protein
MPKKGMNITPAAALPTAQNTALIAIRKQASKLLAEWQKPVVRTAEQFEAAGDAVKSFASTRKELQALLNPIIKAAKADYDAKREAYKAVDNIIAEGEDAIRSALVAYQDIKRKAQEARIEKAVDSGDDTKAARLAAKPYTPDVEGLSFTERWHAEVKDLSALLKAILAGVVDPQAVEPCLPYLNAQARAQHEKLAIPGVEAVKETSSTVRT